MRNQRKFFAFLLIVVVVILFAPYIAMAMQNPPPIAPAPGPTSGMALAQKVIVIAGMVSVLLQGAKKIFPQIQGNVAIVISVLASIAAAYAVAQPGDVISVNFLITAIGSALGANGIHSLVTGGSLPPDNSGGSAQNRMGVGGQNRS